FAIIRELYDGRVAALALVLAAISPTTLLMGATLLSQPTARLGVAGFLYAVLRMLRERPGVKRQLFAVLAGLAIGYAFNTRPLVGLLFGAVRARLVLYRVAARPDRTGFIAPAACLVAAGLLMLGLHFAWNARLTSDPWLSTYHALQQGDRMGFGLRGEGYAPFISDFRIVFTPAYA